MFRFGPFELLLILGIALVVFGPAKLPEIGKALGKGIKEFKNQTNTLTGSNDKATEEGKK
ncbi:twin-arginine translocase TatA/TatE family subunit [Proteinivorax tanatarense]|uniref:Sec-independent protein translocase protein TatA n=1 Tax=Proteinivorax tanatarense TaxID=1260629 RepID=A0AAU7VQK3_9FIRM